MPPRRRRRAGGYPQATYDPLATETIGGSTGTFPGQPDLGGGTGGVGGKGGGFNITNINTAIAQAMAGSPGGTQGATVTTGTGGGAMHHHHHHHH